MAREKEESADVNRVRTLEKSLAVIGILLEGPQRGVRIKDISERLSLGKSTVHRILNTFLAHGYVEQGPDDKRYRLGWKFFEVGSALPRQRNLSNIDLGVLQELSERYEETVNLGIRTGNKVAIVAKADPRRVLFRTGPHLGEQEPLHATALGKALLSGLDEAELDGLFPGEELARFTGKTIVSLSDLRKEIATARQRGYAVDREELSPGLSCIAMPVYNYASEIIAAVSVSGPSFRMNSRKLQACRQGLAEASRHYSAFFGGLSSSE